MISAEQRQKMGVTEQLLRLSVVFFFQAEDGIRDLTVTGVQTCALPIFVNDHAEVAAKVPVEGVHLGQDDDSLAHARKKAGRHIFIGKSTHSLEQAVAAESEGADYIRFGPIFATPTKPDYQPIRQTGNQRGPYQITDPTFFCGPAKNAKLCR